MNEDKTIDCFTCDIVDEYVRLANGFTQDLMDVLLVPMWGIFLGIAGLWIVSHGIRYIFGKPDIFGFMQELMFLIIAAGLLTGQGADLINLIYQASLSTMSGAASVVLSTAGGLEVTDRLNEATGPVSGIQGLEGMTGLVAVAERGVFKVFSVANELLAAATLTNPSPIIFALIMVVPYALLLIVYFAQVVTSIFRVTMFAALSPILMTALGFGWGKNIALSGVRTLFAAFMVLFGATIALAICLYGVKELGVADPDVAGANVRAIASLDNPTLWVAIALGWLGTAFMAEATGMANSIAGSNLTNQAAAVITAGAVGTGLALMKQARGQWGGTLAGAGATVAGGAAQGLGYAAGAMANPGEAAGKLSAGAQAVMDRLNSHKNVGS
ncbi:MAG: hypothetical protein RIC16_03860 [Rhodospirillales bacterium]